MELTDQASYKKDSIIRDSIRHNKAEIYNKYIIDLVNNDNIISTTMKIYPFMKFLI